MVDKVADREPVHARDSLQSPVPGPLVSESELRLRQVRRFVVGLNVEHVYGPQNIDYETNELVVLCLVRNGRPYVKSFIEHYFSLGVRHIVFLDNGSDDGTVRAIQDYDNVTVLSTDLPYRHYKYAMKQYLISRFGKERWSLYVDIDEFFDYPYSDVLSLEALLEYLNERSYTAVVAQMLDMFPEEPLASRPIREDEPLERSHRFYDLSDLNRMDYGKVRRNVSNVISNEDIKGHSGGIRMTLFGVRASLSKHPLVFFDGDIRPMDESSHRTNNARVADFSCVLFHYKFLDDFHEQTLRAVREKNYHLGSAEYKKYLEKLELDPNLPIKQETSRELKSVNDLLDEHFLVISKDYADRVDAKEKEILASMDDPRDLAGALLESRRREKMKTLRMQRLDSRLLARDRSIRDLERQIGERRRAQRSNDQRLRRRIRNLERQLASLRNSRTWRLVSALNRVRKMLPKLRRRSP